MSTQKALLLPVKGGNWELGPSPIPKPAPDEVLVKIVATALNPIDVKIQRDGFWAQEYPFIGGTDAAGVVEDAGSNVVTLVKGDRVFFQGWFENPKATFQQYCVVPAEITAKIPDGFSFDQVASIPLGLATVITGMWGHDPQAASVSLPAPWEEGGLTQCAGKPAFIIGGSSSVGQYAIQMAKMSKFSPIIATASPRNEPLLKSLGVTHALDRSLSTEVILAELKKITGGAPIDFVFDTVSFQETQILGYQALAPGNTLIITQYDEIPAEIKSDDKKTLTMVGNVHLPQNRKVGVEMFKRVAGWLESGELVPNEVEVLTGGLTGIQAGLDRLESGAVSALKLIARPQETV
ncbi:GroES-like protein [Epithele typhae]|uniref:GroES-like protein n=1 Tax=Epithele typhae TaxID=378194 RepID=UPI00200839B4|nr:GroES-like protein [Epithele typhae]KAH9940504.1 GroES-like protein [Epithele typhae]